MKFDKESSTKKFINDTLKDYNTDSEEWQHDITEQVIENVKPFFEQSLARTVLQKDYITPGIPVEYSYGLDDKVSVVAIPNEAQRLAFGHVVNQAYILHGNEGEVRVTPFEGTKFPIRLFRIVTFPMFEAGEVSKSLSGEQLGELCEWSKAIIKQEDARVVTLLQIAGHEQVGSDVPSPKDRCIIANPDNTEIAATYTSYAVPKDTVYSIPNRPADVGVFSIMFDIDGEPINHIDDNRKGWVFDELVGMLVWSDDIQIYKLSQKRVLDYN